MKNIFLTIVVLILFSCKNEPKVQSAKEQTEIFKTNLDTIKLPEKVINSENCYSYLTELIRSSNFPFENIKKEKVNTIIDDDNGELIRAKLIFDTDGTGTIGWVEYKIKERKLYNSSANLEEPVELKYNLTLAEKYEKCRGITVNPKFNNTSNKSLEDIYNQCKLINLPNKYSYEFVSDEKDFIEVPSELYKNFDFEHYSNFKIAKLTKKENIYPILLIIYDESGQSKLYLITLNSTFGIIDKLKLYDSEQVEGGSLSTIYEINKEYNIKIKEAKLVDSGSKVIEKNIKNKNYKIGVDGKFLNQL